MTDADRTDKAEERENMYIMMFTLQSLQNYGLSVKKTVERSLDYLWEYVILSPKGKDSLQSGQIDVKIW